MVALKQKNVNLYKNNINNKVYSPNSITTQASIAGGNPLPTVTPLFISQGLGPNGTANTMVTDIDSALRITEKVQN
jgi:hypothetical protein